MIIIFLTRYNLFLYFNHILIDTLILILPLNWYGMYIGCLQKRDDRDGVRTPRARPTKTEGRSSPHFFARHLTKSLKMVGLGSGCSHSHGLQIAILFHSQVQREGSANVSYLLCKENSSPSQAEAFVPKDTILSFKETSSCPFIVFSRGFKLSVTLNLQGF